MSEFHENRQKLIVAGTLATVAVVLLVRSIAGLNMSAPHPFSGQNDKTNQNQPPFTKRASNVFEPMLRSDRLQNSEHTDYAGNGRNIFKLETVAPRTPPRPKPLPPVPAKEYLPPVLPLKFFGFASFAGGTKKIFFSKDGDVFIGREGDIINRRYKILQVRPTSVEVEDLIDDVRQKLPLDH